MIIIPNQYIEKMNSIFGPSIEEWLTNVPFIINKYIKKFNLLELKFHEDLGINLIIYAKCDEFGEVVIKVSPPYYNELIYRETKALKEFSGQSVCKCYYNNLNDGIRILEKLVPGKTLNDVDNREERIKLFCEVALKLDVKAKDNMNLPTYRQILDRSINQAHEQKEKYEVLLELINISNELYKEIENKKLPKYLLHADLHHDNILTSKDGRKAIDPHGFLGEKVLETARFMEKEIEKKENNKQNVMEIINLISSFFNEEKEIICKVLFIDYVLSTCWDIEMNFCNEHIKNDCYNLNLVLSCLENILNEAKEVVKQLNTHK